MKNELLVHYRKKSGLTQQQVGEHIGISPQAVSKWETGQSEPDIETLCKLAALYQVSVNTLVGADAENEDKEGTGAQDDGFFKRQLKAVIISGAAIFAAVLATVLFIIFAGGEKKQEPPSETSRIDKFTDIELGMTMDEVEKLMGKPDARENSHIESDDPDSLDYQLEEAGMIIQYGLVNCDFWYYCGEEYQKNLEADKNMDFTWEYLPFYQIRVAFDKDGSVVEAYYDPEHEYTSYDYEEKKETKAVEYPDCEFDADIESITALLTFSDGGMYLGTAEISGKDPLISLTHPWGKTNINADGELYSAKITSLTPGMTMDEVKELLGEPDLTDDSFLDADSSAWEKSNMQTQYGIVDCEFLYYTEDEDDEISNIRIAFDKNGMLVEAFYDAVSIFPTFVTERGEEKSGVLVNFCDGKFDKTKNKHNILMIFDDGCIYFGTATLTKHSSYFNTYYTLTTSYGSITLDSDGVAVDE